MVLFFTFSRGYYVRPILLRRALINGSLSQGPAVLIGQAKRDLLAPSAMLDCNAFIILAEHFLPVE
jgi:hypothetical protein